MMSLPVSLVNVPAYQEAIVENGFALLGNVLAQELLDDLSAELSVLSAREESLIRRGEHVYAIRNLLDESPRILALNENPSIRALTEPILGADVRLVRGIYFDKTEQANWKVPWHQDTTIAVSQRIETDGYTGWSVKGGIPHVQPPAEVLQRMLTLRIHLDPADETNGALKVIPGSHRQGRLSAAAIRNCLDTKRVVTCHAERGDVLVMRPLLLHASASGSSPLHRRVLHLEFSTEDLPNGLQWNGAQEAEYTM